MWAGLTSATREQGYTRCSIGPVTLSYLEEKEQKHDDINIDGKLLSHKVLLRKSSYLA